MELNGRQAHDRRRLVTEPQVDGVAVGAGVGRGDLAFGAEVGSLGELGTQEGEDIVNIRLVTSTDDTNFSAVELTNLENVVLGAP